MRCIWKLAEGIENLNLNLKKNGEFVVEHTKNNPEMLRGIVLGLTV